MPKSKERIARRKQSEIVTSGDLARMYGRSRFWAKAVLRRWYQEQLAGGEVRVFVHRDVRNRLVIETSVGALMRAMPPARDEVLHAKVDRVDRDLDFMAKRVDRLTSDRDYLDRRLSRIESALHLKHMG